MASILYFLPTVTQDQVVSDGKLTVETLERFNVAEALRDVVRVPHDASVNEHRKAGPGGRPGVLIAPVSKHNGPPSELSYKPNSQEWIETPSGAWLGYLRHDPPLPYDLERTVYIPGVTLTDRFGQEWQVPIARSRAATYGVLPREFSFDENGKPVPTLDPDWQWLWDLAGEMRDWWVRADDPTFNVRPVEWLVESALKVLGVNYRIGKAEINLLAKLGRNPLQQNFVYRVAAAVVDFDTAAEAKKNSPESSEPPAENSSSSPPGDGAASPDTSPAGER